MKTVHVAFGDGPTGSLKYILSKNRFSKYDGNVINFPEDLSIGPLVMDLSDREEFMVTYLKDLRDSDYKLYHLEQAMKAIRNIRGKEKFTIVLWHGNNVIEQMALRYLAHFLPDRSLIYEVRIPVFKMAGNITKIQKATSECSPEDLFELLNSEDMVLMTKERKETLKMEYDALLSENGALRILEAGKILTVAETFYDEQVLRAVRKEFMLAQTVVGNVLAHTDQVVTDTFIEYRLREIIEEGKVGYRGTLDSKSHYEVCRV